MAQDRIPTLAERKRQLISEELREVALQLLAARGYDETTVDDIVAAAGMSRRTFHRYYASKEEVVIQLLADLGDQMRDELAARPAAESPAVALRHAVTVALDFCADHHDPVKTLAVVRLIQRTPALRARSLELQARWQAGLAAVLARRLGLDAGDLFPDLATRMALAAFDTAMERWALSDGAVDPLALTERAFALLDPALEV
ncbi:acyl-CoA-like ligand-binding transcription factor [Couchioplanes azureus]|uniref:acyl-CoA-like ligand-binding transcription factor n=1 Tax=Couchioplanes caeruleus TaxID=56438 RepID=UPI001989542A|nr:TetR family transcriptional regulator [Couchioplanes caeruleus]GGQ73058.1 TetR family transcriptional regulator [Couchioplanes caeruleus subsp. azureus]